MEETKKRRDMFLTKSIIIKTWNGKKKNSKKCSGFDVLNIIPILNLFWFKCVFYETDIGYL